MFMSFMFHPGLFCLCPEDFRITVSPGPSCVAFDEARSVRGIGALRPQPVVFFCWSFLLEEKGERSQPILPFGSTMSTSHCFVGAFGPGVGSLAKHEDTAHRLKFVVKFEPPWKEKFVSVRSPSNPLLQSIAVRLQWSLQNSGQPFHGVADAISCLPSNNDAYHSACFLQMHQILFCSWASPPHPKQG